MVSDENDDCEQVFNKLPDHGCSEKVTEAIRRWYHPEPKGEEVSDS